MGKKEKPNRPICGVCQGDTIIFLELVGMAPCPSCSFDKSIDTLLKTLGNKVVSAQLLDEKRRITEHNRRINGLG